MLKFPMPNSVIAAQATMRTVTATVWLMDKMVSVTLLAWRLLIGHRHAPREQVQISAETCDRVDATNRYGREVLPIIDLNIRDAIDVEVHRRKYLIALVACSRQSLPFMLRFASGGWFAVDDVRD